MLVPGIEAVGIASPYKLGVVFASIDGPIPYLSWMVEVDCCVGHAPAAMIFICLSVGASTVLNAGSIVLTR